MVEKKNITSEASRWNPCTRDAHQAEAVEEIRRSDDAYQEAHSLHVTNIFTSLSEAVQY